MPKLNQIIAVEKGIKSTVERDVTSAHHNVAKPVLLTGISRNYTPKDDEGDRLPSESTLVQLTVDSVLGDVADSLTRLFDVTATKESANASAAADVVVDGKVIVPKAPVTYLLFLEKQLVNLHTFVSKLPKLDPAEKWLPSNTSASFETEPVETVKTKKVPRVLVKYEATDKHPAQVEVYHEDIAVGTWSTTKFSGAITADRHAELVARVEKLQEAVKFAREEANGVEVDVEVKAGKSVFGYLFS